MAPKPGLCWRPGFGELSGSAGTTADSESGRPVLLDRRDGSPAGSLRAELRRPGAAAAAAWPVAATVTALRELAAILGLPA